MFVSKASAPIALNDACREAHALVTESIRTQIEKRKKDGIPLDDSTDFAFVAEKAKALVGAAEEMDGAVARDLATALSAACHGGLREPSPFSPSPEYEGIHVRIRAVAEGFRVGLGERFATCATLAERHALMREYVAHAIEEVAGLENDEGPIVIARDGDKLTDEAVTILDEAGLVGDLFHVAQRYAEVPASKKKHFGLRPPSTSGTSGVTAAPRESGDSSDATAVPYGATGSPTTSQTPAPAGTY